MQLYQHQTYHMFNRSINREIIYRSHPNYTYFTNKLIAIGYQWELIGFCLMPTHFHLLVRILTADQNKLRRAIGDMLSGYTRAINKHSGRTGSLFQQHTKAKMIKDAAYFRMALHYIHQNPVRAGITRSLTDWPYSSYRDYCGQRVGGIVSGDLVYKYFGSIASFIEESQKMIDVVHL